MGPDGYNHCMTDLHPDSGVAQIRVLHSLMSRPKIKMSMIYQILESCKVYTKRLIGNGDRLQSNQPSSEIVNKFHQGTPLSPVNRRNLLKWYQLSKRSLVRHTILYSEILSICRFEVNQRSDVGIVTEGFHWRSWLLIMTYMRWSQLISFITCSQLAYLMINGVSWMLIMMQQRALNNSQFQIWGPL